MKKIFIALILLISLALSGSYNPNTFSQNTVTLSGDTVTPDADTYNFFDIYLDRAVTRVNMPTGGKGGEPIRFQVRQDVTGGRTIVWGNADANTGLTCNLTKGVDPAVTITVTAGTMDFSTLSTASGRKSYLCFTGFAQNSMNLNDIRITSFDEGAGTITFNHPFYSSTTDVTGDTGAGIEVKSPFYFIDEKGDSWIGQHPFGVTLFEYFDSSADGSGVLMKKGVYTNAVHTKAKVRFEEQLTDDFVNGSDEGLLNWREANDNGTTVVASDDVDTDHQGMLRQRLTGSIEDDCRTSTSLGVDQFRLGNMRVGIEGIIKPNANAFETANVKYYFGWSESQRFYNTTDGAYFEIVADGSGAGRVWCILEDSDSRTEYDTGIDLSEDEYRSLHIGIPSTGVGIHFTVDDITVYEGLMSNVGTDVKMTCGFAQYYDYTDTALPNNKDWFIDSFHLKYRMNADRI